MVMVRVEFILRVQLLPFALEDFLAIDSNYSNVLGLVLGVRTVLTVHCLVMLENRTRGGQFARQVAHLIKTDSHQIAFFKIGI